MDEELMRAPDHFSLVHHAGKLERSYFVASASVAVCGISAGRREEGTDATAGATAAAAAGTAADASSLWALLRVPSSLQEVVGVARSLVSGQRLGTEQTRYYPRLGYWLETMCKHIVLHWPSAHGRGRRYVHRLILRQFVMRGLYAIVEKGYRPMKCVSATGRKNRRKLTRGGVYDLCKIVLSSALADGRAREFAAKMDLVITAFRWLIRDMHLQPTLDAIIDEDVIPRDLHPGYVVGGGGGGGGGLHIIPDAV